MKVTVNYKGVELDIIGTYHQDDNSFEGREVLFNNEDVRDIYDSFDVLDELCSLAIENI